MTESEVLRLAVIGEAVKFVGTTSYKYGASINDMPHATDCSLFTQYIYGKIGVVIPRSSILQAAHAGKIVAEGNDIDFSFVEPADFLFMRGSKGHYDDSLFGGKEIYIGHVALYMGNGVVINARSPYGVIMQELEELQRPWPQYRIILVKRIFE